MSSIHYLPRRSSRHGAVLYLLLALAFTGCTSTTAPASEVGRIAEGMRSHGLEIVNLRPIAPPPQRTKQIVDNQGFDIPGIEIKGKPAGTIRIFQAEKSAESDRRLYGLLGAPGPVTKLDYVNVSGKRELILNHSLPNDVAQRYISAFTSIP